MRDPARFEEKSKPNQVTIRKLNKIKKENAELKKKFEIVSKDLRTTKRQLSKMKTEFKDELSAQRSLVAKYQVNFSYVIGTTIFVFFLEENESSGIRAGKLEGKV